MRAMTSSLERRSAYPHFLAIPTRWMDNDVYGHVNNVVYYSYFDTVINAYLIREGGLDIRDGAVVGYCVESNCRYHRPVTFPETLDAGLRVAHLGASSVRYEIGLFREGRAEPAATGHQGQADGHPGQHPRLPGKTDPQVGRFPTAESNQPKAAPGR